MDGEFEIINFEKKYEGDVINLILSIQRGEFNISISEDEQPDLKNIQAFYQHGLGNFWIAISDDQVIGTIGLVDIGSNKLALRKMFVDQGFRGKEKGLANELMQTAISWGRERNIKDIYLGTVEVLKGAHRFYEKNGFHRIEKEDLPPNFPQMGVDTMFYHLKI